MKVYAFLGFVMLLIVCLQTSEQASFKDILR